MIVDQKPLRPIRSYVLRQGRITPSQREAIKTGWPSYGLDLPTFGEKIDWRTLFGREAPRILEIGFGMGDSLIATAKKHPEWDFIGVEVHQPGIGACLAKAQILGLTNLKVIAQDAIAVLNTAISPASLDKVLLLFPDPWPKKKHHKRRIVQPSFIELIAQALKPEGCFHLATDWQDYADHMLAVLDASSAFTNAFGRNYFAPAAIDRIPTKFEIRGKKLGHSIWDLIYIRQ